MLGPALGAEEPGLAEGRGAVPALPALLWPLLALGAAAAALLVRRGLRRGPATEEEEAEEEEVEPRQQREEARSSAQKCSVSFTQFPLIWETSPALQSVTGTGPRGKARPARTSVSIYENQIRS